MNAAAFLADTGNIGLAVCAVLDTAGVISYALRARGGAAGKWWKTPFGVHLMCFMAAFAVVLDQSVIYLLTGPGLIVARAPGVQPDWFAWVRTVSFSVLIPGVLAWRLWLILWPPKRLGDLLETTAVPSDEPSRAHLGRDGGVRHRGHDRERRARTRRDRHAGYRRRSRRGRRAVHPAEGDPGH